MSIDAPTIYEVPILMQAQGLDETILKEMDFSGDTPGLGPWRAFLERRHKAETTEPVHIALVGKYDLQDAYKSIREALSQAGTYNDRKVSVDFVNSEKLTDENVAEALKGMSGVLIGPGFWRTWHCRKVRSHQICAYTRYLIIRYLPGYNALPLNLPATYWDTLMPIRAKWMKRHRTTLSTHEEQKSITNMGVYDASGALTNAYCKKRSKAYEAYGHEHIQSATVTAMSSTTHIRQSMKRPACRYGH